MSTALQLFEQFKDDSKYNILRPTQAVMAAQNPLMTVYANVVKFDVEADTYPVDGGKRALFGRALTQVASGAGISFVNVSRLDNGQDPAVAHISVLAMMKRPDGTMIHTTGQKRVDARAYSTQKYGADYASKSDGVKFYNQLVKFVSERAETGAKSRAIRQLLAMKAAYTPKELALPFVIPQIVVNMAAIVATEFGMRLAIEQALGAASSLYGTGNALPPSTSPGMGTAALPPAGESVEHHPDQPAAAAQHAETRPAEATAYDVVTAASETPVTDAVLAEAKARLARINQLLAEREHGMTEKQIESLRTTGQTQQVSGIVWLEGKPMKAQADAFSGDLKWKPTEKQIKRLYAIAKNSGRDGILLHECIEEWYGGITSVNDLTKEQYEELTGTDTDPGRLAENPYRKPAEEIEGDDKLPWEN